MIQHILQNTGHKVSNTFVNEFLATVDMTYVPCIAQRLTRPLLTLPLPLSCKVPETKQIKKYSDFNMAYYLQLMEWLRLQDPEKLTVSNEAYFQNVILLHPQLGPMFGTHRNCFQQFTDLKSNVLTCIFKHSPTWRNRSRKSPTVVIGSSSSFTNLD